MDGIYYFPATKSVVSKMSPHALLLNISQVIRRSLTSRHKNHRQVLLEYVVFFFIIFTPFMAINKIHREAHEGHEECNIKIQSDNAGSVVLQCTIAVIISYVLRILWFMF